MVKKNLCGINEKPVMNMVTKLNLYKLPLKEK